MFDDHIFRLAEEDDDDMDMLPAMMSVEGDEDDDISKPEERYPTELPVLPLKNMVMFPKVMFPVTIGREKSIQAANEAYQSDKWVAVVAQRESTTEDPNFADLYNVGVLAKIVRLLKMPDGTITALLQGRVRINILELTQLEPYLRASVEVLHEEPLENKEEIEAFASMVKELGEQIVQLSPNIPSEATNVLRNIRNHNFLFNFVSANLNITVAGKQTILEASDMRERAELILQNMNAELNILRIKDQIDNKVRTD